MLFQCRNSSALGWAVEHNKNDPAFVAAADAAASAFESATSAADEPHGDPGSGLDFDPVAVAWRSDGWTPAKQRGFIDALADCGVVREAAARVGMSERSANYLRRRDGAASFGRAWDMAIRLGAGRLGSVAYERAVLGTVKPHFYRGRVVGEERVYDNRLLLSLLAKADKSVDPVDVSAVLADWDGWMDAIEHGLDAP